MANNDIPRTIADFESQISTAISIGDTSFSLSSVLDDDGIALPDGVYCFTLDNGTTAKEYFIGSLVGSEVSSIKSVSRQGTETSGAVRAHRVGASVILTDFASIQRVADVLRGALELDGSAPLSYDSTPTLSDGDQLATVAYVLSVVNGGAVEFDTQSYTGVAGETIAAGEQVYFKESDQRWWLVDNDTSATYLGVQLGTVTSGNTAGNACTIALSGPASVFTGLTAGTKYYTSATAGAVSASSGGAFIGTAVNTTTIMLDYRRVSIPSLDEKAAMAGGGAYGTPSASNLFMTTSYLNPPQVVQFTSSGTWTKDAGLKYIVVELVGGGGGGSYVTSSDKAAGSGSGGGYSRKVILASSLGATETVTIGAAGVGGIAPSTAATAGGTTSFGSHCSATGGGAGTTSVAGNPGVGSGGDVNKYGGYGSDQIDTSVASPAPSRGGDSEFGRGGHLMTSGSTGPGTGYGSGSSGAYTVGTTDYNAANAQPGIVIVTEYYI